MGEVMFWGSESSEKQADVSGLIATQGHGDAWAWANATPPHTHTLAKTQENWSCPSPAEALRKDVPIPTWAAQ